MRQRPKSPLRYLIYFSTDFNLRLPCALPWVPTVPPTFASHLSVLSFSNKGLLDNFVQEHLSGTFEKDHESKTSHRIRFPIACYRTPWSCTLHALALSEKTINIILMDWANLKQQNICKHFWFGFEIIPLIEEVHQIVCIGDKIRSHNRFRDRFSPHWEELRIN